jgi:acyl-coenzyme A synthetase/AMP-(fatty) acid ligase
VYGPAEVNQCTVYNFNSSLKIDNTLPLGVTSFNAEVLVVDENNKSLPTNTIGELLVRSSTMMLGYWNKPELTQSKLYHDHQNGVIKSFYCTGDLVKIDELGQLLFYGRKDRQVKVRGYRVELSEVEAHITSIFNISEVAVIKTKDSYLHAYVEGSINFSEKEIKRKLSKKLSTYALPDKITFVDKIPRTQAGKIDYNCLIMKS